jgi:hypothetical protein
MKKIIHKIAHLLGLNEGQPESFYIGNALYTGFRCYGCGKINDASIKGFRDEVTSNN